MVDIFMGHRVYANYKLIFKLQYDESLPLSVAALISEIKQRLNLC